MAINFTTIFSTAVPLVIKTIIDSVIGDKPFEVPEKIKVIIEAAGAKNYFVNNLWIPFAILVLLTFGQGVFLYLKGKLSALASQNSGKRIRDHIFDHIQHLPYDYHVKSKAGELIQRCTSDVETVQNFISGQFVEIGQTIISFCYLMFVMLSLDVKYSLVSIILVPFIMMSTFIFFTNMKKIFKLADESDGYLSATLQENLTGVRVVRAFGAQNFEMDKFDEKNRDFRDQIYKIIRLMANFWSTSDFLCLLQFVIVLFTGVYWAAAEVISLGTLVAFTTYAGMLIWPIRHLGQILAVMGQAFVSLGRIQEILDCKEEYSSQPELLPQISGEIEFKNVSFQYEEGKPVLSDVSFKIRKGQTAAFLGATGSGKSSLVHLLIRLYDYQKGSVKIDGTELRKIDKKWLRKNVGIVLQEPFLFSKTIKENIRFGRWDAGDEEIYESASAAAIHDTVKGFDSSYDTLIGERGVTLSGGQRQRLAIARTIIRNAPIMIFDDSLSAVDMETDAMIRRALREKSADTTTIIISHRITTLAEADVIYVLEGGRIKQSGTHQQLIKQDGLYKRVWEIQNSLEEELSDVG